MDDRLPPHREAAEPVRIGVAAEQQRLIDEHRAVPHRGRAAELGQHHPRDHRLDEEEQEAADKDRQHEQPAARSEEHTSELQSLMRISYAVFCLKKKTKQKKHT